MRDERSLRSVWPPSMPRWRVLSRDLEAQAQGLAGEGKRQRLQRGEDWRRAVVVGTAVPHCLSPVSCSPLSLKFLLASVTKSRGICVEVANGMNSQGQGGGQDPVVKAESEMREEGSLDGWMAGAACVDFIL